MHSAKVPREKDGTFWLSLEVVVLVAKQHLSATALSKAACCQPNLTLLCGWGVRLHVDGGFLRQERVGYILASGLIAATQSPCGWNSTRAP